jgi:hypothetical protein
MTRTRVTRDVVAVIALTIAVLLPVTIYVVLNSKTNHNAQVAFVTQCRTANGTRRSVEHIVDKLAQRSKISATANKGAPNQTPEQRAATARNLEIINNLQTFAHGQLHPNNCTYPPLPPSATTTVPRSTTTRSP